MVIPKPPREKNLGQRHWPDAAGWKETDPFSEDSQIKHPCQSAESFSCLASATKMCLYLSEHGVVDGAQVDRPFVGQVIENVEGPGSFGSLLLVAKDEIDPLVQLAGDELTLQSLEGGGMSRDGGL